MKLMENEYGIKMGFYKEITLNDEILEHIN